MGRKTARTTSTSSTTATDGSPSPTTAIDSPTLITVDLMTTAVVTSPANALYVSTTGSDSNSGTITSPLRTISRAASLALPGTTVIVRGGTYTDAVKICNSGTASANIVFQPYAGEKVILSGSALAAKTDVVSIFGNYVTFQGFQVSNSPAHGIIAWGNHGVQILNNTVNGSWSSGIWVGGDTVGQSYGNLIQGNTVYGNVLQNASKISTSGWAQGISADISDDTRIIGNAVYNNFGEGIGDQKSSRVTIANNTVHDNYSANIYLDNAPSALVNANFIFSSGDQTYFVRNHPADGILAAIETCSVARPLSNLVITNNIDVGDRSGFYYGNYQTGGGMQNALIANNTFVGQTAEAINIDASTGSSGNRVVNNIFDRTTAGSLATGSVQGMSFDHNDWFGSAAGVFAGAGDRAVNPNLVNPGSLSPSGYKLLSSSPVGSVGATLANVTADYFGGARNSIFSIGAHQP